MAGAAKVQLRPAPQLGDAELAALFRIQPRQQQPVRCHTGGKADIVPLVHGVAEGDIPVLLHLLDRYGVIRICGPDLQGLQPPAAAGKLLLNIICGSIPIEGGDVLVGSRSISKLKDYQRYATMGRVYQDPAAGTCPNLTMLENLSLADNKGGSYGLGRGVNKKRIDFYRQQLASLGLGLEDKLDVRMGALSGGQRQAVALLMATMTPLKFLILDEHTAALDPKTAEVIMALTDRVICEKHLTAMMVTHNLRYAVEYGDRILMMNRGRVVLDRAGAEKRATSMDDILTMFNQISLETGN